MNYKEFTNKQLANELYYMPAMSDLSPSEFELLQVIASRLKISVIQQPAQPKSKKKGKKKCKANIQTKKNI